MQTGSDFRQLTKTALPKEPEFIVDNSNIDDTDNKAKSDHELARLYKMGIEGDAMALRQLSDYHLQSGKYEKAKEVILILANKGDAIAQYNLGNIYQKHLNNSEEAIRWWERASISRPEAAYNIGLVYFNGYNRVPVNKQLAFKWYKIAANNGYASGQYNVGYMYYNGVGVKQNVEEAIKWYRLAADSDDQTVSSKAIQMLEEIGVI